MCPRGAACQHVRRCDRARHASLSLRGASRSHWACPFWSFAAAIANGRVAIHSTAARHLKVVSASAAILRLAPTAGITHWSPISPQGEKAMSFPFWGLALLARRWFTTARIRAMPALSLDSTGGADMPGARVKRMIAAGRLHLQGNESATADDYAVKQVMKVAVSDYSALEQMEAIGLLRVEFPQRGQARQG
jgi:hypothetical protein